MKLSHAGWLVLPGGLRLADAVDLGGKRPPAEQLQELLGGDRLDPAVAVPDSAGVGHPLGKRDARGRRTRVVLLSVGHLTASPE